MITPGSRTLVSTFALAIALSPALGACARVQSAENPVSAPSSAEASVDRPAIPFDNQAGVYVDVYLIADQHQWRLGRVMPGGRATLQVPSDDLAKISGFVQLAVLANAPVSLQVARDPHAILTIAQPLSVLVTQGWAFAASQSASAQLVSTPKRQW